MESRNYIYRQTAVVAVGVALCSAVMVGVFYLLGLYDATVLWGALAGSLICVVNFFVMALCTDLAADKAAGGEDVKGGQALLQLSYIGRMLGLFLVWFLCSRTGFFNLFALVIPIVFVRPVLTIAEFFRKSGESKG